MSYEIILQENVVSDNILILPDSGKIFKGGYVAIIKEYVFLNAWQDREIIKKFRKSTSLDKYLLKKYPNTSILN
jgi:hypothetical protein